METVGYAPPLKRSVESGEFFDPSLRFELPLATTDSRRNDASERHWVEWPLDKPETLVRITMPVREIG